MAGNSECDDTPHDGRCDIVRRPQCRCESGTDLIKCLEIEGDIFCTEFGFMSEKVKDDLLRQVAKWDVSTPLESRDTDTGGDLSLEETLRQLSEMSESELIERQNVQISDARKALQGALERGDTDVAAAASTNVTTTAAAALPATKFVMAMTGFRKSKLRQEKSYYCGPASMAAIARGDAGSWKTQTYWAGLLNTEQQGATGIYDLVGLVNSATTWDTKSGTYTVWGVDGKTTAQFRDKIKNKIVAGGPIMLHPTLRKEFFGYLNYNHGGHFQVGTGYTGTLVQFIEPYPEAIFMPNGGAPSAGYQAIEFGPMRQATVWTSTLALRNIGL